VNLHELLTETAARLPDVEASAAPSGEVTWSDAGRPFAALDGDGAAAEFALDPAVAAAACRTPDVALSGRGPGWVRFGPAALDDHGLDRARAWFESAQRRLRPG
jgi:hypothetical protein